MTEGEFLKLVSGVRPVRDAAILDVPLEHTAFDSLDLLEIRCALELRLDRSLSEERFVPSSTLRDLYLLVCQCPTF